MKVGILQPYFFPYIGYFQLIAAVDKLVFFDDVQYIKGGWINRNLVRQGNGAKWLTMPVRKAPLDTAIKDRTYLPRQSGADDPLLALIAACYSKAPHFHEAFPLFCELMASEDRNVSIFNANLLVRIARALGARCDFVFSSELEQTPGLRGQQRVVDICERLGATHYINPPGGVGLYDHATFRDRGLVLSFLRTTTPPALLRDGYQHLSIIDFLMHEGARGCERHMDEFELVAG